MLATKPRDSVHSLCKMDDWLKEASQENPEYALNATEIYLNYMVETNSSIYDTQNNFAQLITCLFAEAEEREEADGGRMLQRVIKLQDILLAKGVDSINQWLKKAERP